MKYLSRGTHILILMLALLLVACQPVMPVETASSAAAPSAAEEAPPNYPDLPGEILIPAGSFQMGCDDGNKRESCLPKELPLHTVYLDAYYIDQFEVTNARYQACVDAGVCTPPKYTYSSTRDEYFGNPDFADYPVLIMDWDPAQEFCVWEGKRLPTEAEWMKAARGDQDTRKHPWGDETPTCEIANYWEGTNGCVADTVAVGSYSAGASPYGVMDMAGNVYEWVNDWYADDYYSISPSDYPQGPENGTYRVLLGSGWASPGFLLRNAGRSHVNAYRAPDIGFRCAHSP